MEPTDIATHITGFPVSEAEEVREVIQCVVRQRVDVSVRKQRYDICEPESVRVVEIGTEAIEPDHPMTPGRGEVSEERDQPRHPVVLFRRLPGETPDQIPARVDAQLFAPLQELDILQRSHTLAHQLEDGITEALDPGLDVTDARVPQHSQLRLLEVRLHLVKQGGAGRAASQLRHEILEVGHVQDVVGHGDVATGVTLAQASQLVERSAGGLAAKGHRLAVESAERAMHPFAPPTAPRGLEEYARLPVRTEPTGLELLEVVAVVGIR